MDERGWRSRLGRRISAWADSSDQNARDLQRTLVTTGASSIAKATNRDRVTLAGVLRSVTLRPRSGTPVLEAELDDGSGVVTLRWLGQRRIAGIEAGRKLTVTGSIGVHDGVRVIHNPRYELRHE